MAVMQAHFSLHEAACYLAGFCTCHLHGHQHNRAVRIPVQFCAVQFVSHSAQQVHNVGIQAEEAHICTRCIPEAARSIAGFA